MLCCSLGVINYKETELALGNFTAKCLDFLFPGTDFIFY